MNVIIPLGCFILFNYGLVHVGLPSWYSNKRRYRYNERIYFTIGEKDFVTKNETTNLIKKEQDCKK